MSAFSFLSLQVVLSFFRIREVTSGNVKIQPLLLAGDLKIFPQNQKGRLEKIVSRYTLLEGRKKE